MAIIPSDEQFRTTIAEVDLTNKGTGLQQLMNNVFTMQDIDDTVERPFETINEGNGDGIVIRNRVAANYGNVGLEAIDMSISDSASTTKGATGESSFAIGSNATASGVHSIAMGQNASALGSRSIALYGYASETNSTSIGTGATGGATGSRSFAAAGSAWADGLDSVSIGYFSQATESNTTALGREAKARAANATAIGVGSFSEYADSTAIGGATTTAANQIALGDAHTILIAALATSTSYADDAAAAAGGVLVGELYRDGSVVKIRVV